MAAPIINAEAGESIRPLSSEAPESEGVVEPAASRWRTRANAERLLSALSPILLLLVWKVAALAGAVDTRFFPAPSSIFRALWEMLKTGELWGHVSISLQRSGRCCHASHRDLLSPVPPASGWRMRPSRGPTLSSSGGASRPPVRFRRVDQAAHQLLATRALAEVAAVVHAGRPHDRGRAIAQQLLPGLAGSLSRRVVVQCQHDHLRRLRGEQDFLLHGRRGLCAHGADGGVAPADGDEARAVLRRERPAVALLDLYMPDGTGLDVCRAIRSDPDLRGRAAILLTVGTHSGEEAAGAAAGADDHLPKPFSPVALPWKMLDGLRPRNER